MSCDRAEFGQLGGDRGEYLQFKNKEIINLNQLSWPDEF